MLNKCIHVEQVHKTKLNFLERSSDTLYNFNKIAPSLVYLNILKMLKTLSVGICDVSVYTFMEAISMWRIYFIYQHNIFKDKF